MVDGAAAGAFVTAFAAVAFRMLLFALLPQQSRDRCHHFCRSRCYCFDPNERQSLSYEDVDDAAVAA